MTDIVDSTLTVARHGDRRWREMLADHYADCRALTELAGGGCVSTTGDGVIAIFDGPTRAVRAAIAIEAAARASGIAVRAGVHTGECERMSQGLAGLAVHIAARICALAGADEVVTTGSCAFSCSAPCSTSSLEGSTSCEACPVIGPSSGPPTRGRGAERGGAADFRGPARGLSDAVSASELAGHDVVVGAEGEDPRQEPHAAALGALEPCARAGPGRTPPRR